TLGQRHGLGIGGPGEPWFVVGKNVKENILYVEQGYHHEALYSDALVATGMNWVNGIPENKTFTSYAKCRYRQEDTKVFVTELEETQRVITPGQEFVLYDGRVCLGGGIIDNIYKNKEEIKYVG